VKKLKINHPNHAYRTGRPLFEKEGLTQIIFPLFIKEGDRG
jgi:hypothetical protein